MKFVVVELGYESDHVHFLIQSVPSLSVSEIVRKLKNLTAKHLFKRHPKIKLRGNNFWTRAYYANEKMIRKYVESQGKEKDYAKVHSGKLNLLWIQNYSVR